MNPRGGERRSISLHADDFGMNASVNAGILAGFRRGLLTGTSLLANGPAAEAAAESWATLERERSAGELPSAEGRRRLADSDRPFDLGWHLNLTQGTPLSDDYPAELRDADGSFCGVWRLALRLARTGSLYRPAIEREIAAQLGRAAALGLSITRVDGHQYVEMLPTVAGALREQLPRYGVRSLRLPREPHLGRTTLVEGRPAAWFLARIKGRFAGRYVRRMTIGGFAGPRFYFGTAHAGRITLHKLRQFVAAMGDGESAEVGLHPAETAADVAAGGPWFDPLAGRRPRELEMLVHPELAADLATLGVRLDRVTRPGATP